MTEPARKQTLQEIVTGLLELSAMVLVITGLLGGAMMSFKLLALWLGS